MVMDNYPGNEDLALQRKAILGLEKSRDFDALKLAKHDLYAMIKVKEKWLEEKWLKKK